MGLSSANAATFHLLFYNPRHYPRLRIPRRCGLAHPQKGNIMANVILQQAIAQQAIDTAKAQFSATQGMAGKYDALAKVAANGTKVADVETHDALRVQYVYGYVTAAGIKASVDDKSRVVIANADAATKADMDAFDDCKRDARSAFGMGMNRAYARLGIEPPAKKNAGGAKATTPAAAPTTTESVLAIPPTMLHDMETLVQSLVHFQTTAKLTKDGKEAIGKVADQARSLFERMQGAKQPAPKSDAPKS